jgi:hypothetical protein
MIFKRLKILVAVSLVMFIFIVGNVFAFGFLYKTNKDNLQNNNKQYNQIKLNTIISEKKKSQGSINKTGTTPQKENSPSQSPPKKRRRTHAS